MVKNAQSSLKIDEELGKRLDFKINTTAIKISKKPKLPKLYFPNQYLKANEFVIRIQIHEVLQKNPEASIVSFLTEILTKFPYEMPPAVARILTNFIFEEWERQQEKSAATKLAA